MSSLKQNSRPIVLTISPVPEENAIPAPIEALEAILELIRNTEETGTSLTNKVLSVTGRTPYKIYQFEVSSNFETFTYDVIYLGEAPNVESL